MNKQLIIVASVFGILAVILGAFGAHGLKNLLDPAGIEVWTTAVNYQFYHTFALLFLALTPASELKLIKRAALFFVLGILLFSGSLYLISLKEVLGISSLAVLGPVTPLGGFCFILGWFTLLLAALKK